MQPHFVANPIFAPGIIDPLPARLAWLDGAPVVTVPDAEHFETAPHHPSMSTASDNRVPLDRRLTGLLRKLMSAEHGTRHRLIFWTGARLGELVEAGQMTEDYAVAWIGAVCKAAGFPNPDHIKKTAEDGILSGRTTRRPITEFEVMNNV